LEETFQLRPSAQEAASHEKTWRENISGDRPSKCKGPEVGMCLVQSEQETEIGDQGRHQITEGSLGLFESSGESLRT
jgi:hypothetical protein